MEPAESNFEAALSSLAALTTFQPQLTGAPPIIEATKKLIEEKIKTLALTPRKYSPSISDYVKYLPSLAKIRGELQRSNMDAVQVDGIIDQQLQALQNRLDDTLWVDMAEYQALLETGRIISSEAPGFDFQTLDALINDVAGRLCEEAEAVNEVLRSPGMETADTPPPEATKGSIGEESGNEASELEETSDVDPPQGPEVMEGSSGEMEFSDEDMSSKMPR